MAMEAAAIDIDAPDDDPELIADGGGELPKGATAGSSGEDAFWNRNGAMFAMQRYRNGQEMTARMNELTADVKTEINIEREERNNALRDVNQNLKMMDDKMTKELERRDHNMESMNSAVEELTNKVAGMESGTHQASRAKGQENRRPTHVVLGGWGPKAPKDIIEKEAQQWLDSLDKETKGPANRADCPRLYGTIANVKVPEELLVRTAFRWQCNMDLTAPMDHRDGPSPSHRPRSAPEGGESDAQPSG